MIRLPYRFRAIEGKLSNKYIHYIRYQVDCTLENLYIKNVKLPQSGIRMQHSDTKKIIVSLTSYPQRMGQTYYAIKSLMLQTLQADRIVLWLAESQFPGRTLPAKFEDLVSRGLEVRFVPDDLRSHKKYYYSLREQNINEVVITFDDDLIYESNAIEKLYLKHIEYPGCIICNRGQTIKLDDKGSIKPYNQWETYSNKGVNAPTLMVMPSTGAGCLYPHDVMPESTFDVESIKELAFTADDIWIKFNSLTNRVPVVKTLYETAMLCTIKHSQASHLGEVNCIQGANDKIVAALSNHFPNVPSILRNANNMDK